MKERLFTAADGVGLVLPHCGPGYLTFGNPSLSTAAYVHGGPSRAGTTLRWISCAQEAVVQHAREASHRGVVELFPSGERSGNAGLGLALAEHLAQQRGPHAFVGPCSLARPAAPQGTVCLPHLVAAGTSTGARCLPVWEILTVCEAHTWLGQAVSVPDLEFFEQHLPQLLALKHHSPTPRTWQPTPARQQLSHLLHDEDRYVSIRLVLQHADLFRTLIAESLR